MHLTAGRIQNTLIRCLDLALSSILLVLLFPIGLIIGLAVALDSPGPFLFRQVRLGKDARPFRMYKFRTMSLNEDTPPLRKDSNGQPEPVIKKRRDPRITRIGLFLRRYSLDELPQLINIIRNEMSLVGPRPPVPEEYAVYSEHQKKRLHQKPGITGLAQINGRSDLDFKTIVEYDIHFNTHRSLWLYLKILVLSVPFVLGGKSAY